MKLSDAIRLGAMATPQAFGKLVDQFHGGTCAIGSACVAAGIALDNSDVAASLIRAAFPVLSYMPMRHSRPADIASVQDVGCTIIRLNDCLEWSRERIADWVETIERELEAEKPAAETVHA